MAKRAIGGGLVGGPDAAAAAAFAAQLDAETRREELRLKSVGRSERKAKVRSPVWWITASRPPASALSLVFSVLPPDWGRHCPLAYPLL